MMKVVRASLQYKATVIGEKIAVADTSFTRFLGLMGRRSMDSGCGLWIKPSSGVHTFWMRMKIDVVALDRQHRVLSIGHSVAPWRISGLSLKTASVLELPEGKCLSLGIQPGDVLQFSQVDDH
jgi:uncharacterized membrane protein (UPF0127 family)